MDLYDYTVTDNKGEKISLAAYRDKVLLIVNTATGCGFTPQYKGLQDVYEKHRAAGFEILDFPCNQFANQAPGSGEEIASFCSLNYGTTFKQFAKIEVNGPGEAPLYTFLKAQKGGVMGGAIKWNFTKFLLDRNGTVVERFAPTTTPEKIEGAVMALLDEKAEGTV